jgi:hypothetical protein
MGSYPHAYDCLKHNDGTRAYAPSQGGNKLLGNQECQKFDLVSLAVA